LRGVGNDQGRVFPKKERTNCEPHKCNELACGINHGSEDLKLEPGNREKLIVSTPRGQILP